MELRSALEIEEAALLLPPNRAKDYD